MAQIPKTPSQYWHRYAEYRLISLSELLRKIPSQVPMPEPLREECSIIHNELVIIPADGTKMQRYALLNSPAIYSELINIWDDNGNYAIPRLISWLENYGLPCVSIGSLDNTAATLSPFRSKLNDDGFSQTRDLLKQRLNSENWLSSTLGTDLMLLSTLKQFAQDLRDCFHLYRALKDQDDKMVIALVHGYETINNLDKWIAACGKNPYDDIPRESTYRLAWDRFLKHLAGHIDRIAPRPVKVQPQNPFNADLRPEYKVPDLIAAVWLHFYWDITGDGVRYVTCKECKEMFRVTHRGQQYCTSGGSTVNSPCKKKWDTQQLRARKAATAPPVPSN